MICDYYIVRKGYFEVKELYSARKESPYYYVFGFSWHAYAAYFAGILLNIVGFVGAVGRQVPIGATYIYNLNFFGGFFTSMSVYFLLTRVWPIPATSHTWNEMDVDVLMADGESVSIDQDSFKRGFDEEQLKGDNELKSRVTVNK